MEIREATENDIPNILKVLKASLGETSSRKTETVWRYKHVENPFGKSLVLIAIEEGEIIGVRAFMRWKWQRGDEIFSAFRAVDTATHPSHQGKGVFKKLTLKALEVAKQNGDHFVFNTPNNQSLPGYLKMDWKKIDKLKVELIPINPLRWRKYDKTQKIKNENSNLDIAFLTDWTRRNKGTGKLFTPKSSEYLKWRYFNNPLQDYRIFSNEGYFIAGYVKERGSYAELRISELIYDSSASKTQIKKTIKEWGKEVGVQMVSIHVPIENTLFLGSVSGKFGPVFTFRNINVGSAENEFLNLKNWDYSLGDLELF